MSTPNEQHHPLARVSRFILRRAVPSWLVSMAVHVALLIVLALVTIGPRAEELLAEFTMGPQDSQELEPLDESPPIEMPPLDVELPSANSSAIEPLEPSPKESLSPELERNEVTEAAIDFAELLGDMPINIDELTLPTGPAIATEPYKNRRTPESRLQQALAADGCRESELAVARALAWIVSRQSADGGWNFNHNQSLHPRPCPDPGTAEQARNGAAGMALLPLLGAGQTHKEGVYQKQVRAGLGYLVKHMRVSSKTGSWHEAEGNLYSHGLASIAVCEAYAMTHDRELFAPAQLAINYIVDAQDPVGGGWRYAPRQAGDTSVVGWQLMALKSGHMAYLVVPKPAINGVSKFLDSVQANSGAEYGYTGPAAGREATSSIGLLCRMYLGWKRDNPALVRGVEIIDRRGPSTSDMYYNYYATQVCRQYGGEPWTRWNARMRDWLIAEQETAGAKAGSWHMPGGHAGQRGGRLYSTALAAMILEVYYRQMPLYQQQAADDDFAL